MYSHYSVVQPIMCHGGRSQAFILKRHIYQSRFFCLFVFVVIGCEHPRRAVCSGFDFARTVHPRILFTRFNVAIALHDVVTKITSRPTNITSTTPSHRNEKDTVSLDIVQNTRLITFALYRYIFYLDHVLSYRRVSVFISYRAYRVRITV